MMKNLPKTRDRRSIFFLNRGITMIKEPVAENPARKVLPEEIAALPSPPGRPTAAEQEMLDQFDAQRRLALLRIILPGLLVVTLLGLIFSIQTDIASGGDLRSSL